MCLLFFWEVGRGRIEHLNTCKGLNCSQRWPLVFMRLSISGLFLLWFSSRNPRQSSGLLPGALSLSKPWTPIYTCSSLMWDLFITCWVFHCLQQSQQTCLLNRQASDISLPGSFVVLVPKPCPTPARLLCPWDSSGKSTGVGCHFLFQGIFPTQGLKLCNLAVFVILKFLKTEAVVTVFPCS